jgi:hypothetical protein
MTRVSVPGLCQNDQFLLRMFCLIVKVISRRGKQGSYTASDCSTSATGTVLSCYIMPSASHSSPTHNPAFRRNLVHLIPHMLAARRLQIPHCRFHVGVTEPLLNCTQIDASPQRPPSERRSELVQPRPAAFRHSVSARACALTLIPSLDGFEEYRSSEGDEGFK